MMLNMGRIPGVGLAKGLSITLRHMLRKSVTQQYPEVKPALPPRSRGVIALVEENCTSCMLCARECPDWCIYIDSHKETIPAPEGGRARQRNVLDRFAIDFSLCMYCGICIEVCPFDALFWSPEFEYAEGDIRNLLHEKDKLAAWTQTVPPPPAHDPGAEPPKERTAAPRRPAADRASRTTPSGRQPTAPKPASGTAPSDQAGRTTATPGSRAGTPAGTTVPEGAADPATAPDPEGTADPAPAGGRERPRRSVADVRAIRPPGALPSGARSDAPAEGRDPADTGGPAAPPTGPEDSEPESAEDTGRSTDRSEESEAHPRGPASSTGRPSPDTLSTASSQPQPEPGSPEQTSPASPRKRRMADPRSIRPPGRLGPDDTGESEEES
ncbi:4Fe-4S binding protein [Nonomuraea sp. B1E8]|uniref:NuoI/complex I 23 kDa subunit family protein n=1 Tax=unclassified Nonomuraea TaxID=2593643 RepID=UPI00325D74E9